MSQQASYPAPCSGDRSKAPVVWPTKVQLFGVLVTPCTYSDISRTIVDAAMKRQPAVVSCHAVHALVESSNDPKLRNGVNRFDAVTPDGQPVRWALNFFYRTKLEDRVYGPQLTLDVCRLAAEEGVSVYFYGGSEKAVRLMTANLQQTVPELKVAGFESPPFRELTDEEDLAVIDRIHRSGAGIVFIGLGFPKQDLFAAAHQDRIDAVQICVGAAFDFHAGLKKTAPGWMQRNGLEWLFRLSQEPFRLWRRYLTTNSQFLWKFAMALPQIQNTRRALHLRTTPGEHRV